MRNRLLPLFQPALAPWALLTLVPLFSGCVALVPLPTASGNHGQPVNTAQTSFIQPGQTTRQEVLAQLGTNCVSLFRQSAIAYPWEARGMGVNWTVCIVAPYTGIFEDKAFTPVSGGWQALFVAFDEQGTVRAVAFKHLSENRSLHDHLDRWVTKLPNQTAAPR